ncbi:unnamed protein product [Symbiodinium natans]|uniref:Uncharacterized protein n=1 Tax=Symbiodinium natans TaxID=878477 RepID=A0A812NXN7_9DINO|nr:unnamed protein product [Symbiodinium natans]
MPVIKSMRKFTRALSRKTVRVTLGLGGLVFEEVHFNMKVFALARRLATEHWGAWELRVVSENNVPAATGPA